MAKQTVYDLNKDALNDTLKSLGQPAFRTTQILDGLYSKLYQDFNQFANIPSSLRASLAEMFVIDPLHVEDTIVSKDRLTEKVLFTLGDGLQVETVLMRYSERNSLCISTQVGCPMGCVFCATGQMGYMRNLSPGEIVGQVIWAMRKLRAEDSTLTNVVYMGMGEPFLNFEGTLASIANLTNPDMLNFGSRRITVSTVGIIPKIAMFAREHPQVNLAISLHSPEDLLRSELVPANRIYPLKSLIQASRDYVERTHRRITFEYALIQDVNDSPELALKLAGLLTGMLCHVNLIALNPSKEYAVQGSSKDRVLTFQSVLEEHGIPVTVRLRRGIEIHAGCGQLARSRQPE